MTENYIGPDRRKPANCSEGPTCAHVSSVAEEAADRAVREVFAKFGVDIDKPDQVAEFQADLRFGSRLRRIADHGAMAMVAALGVGVLAALWAGITSKLGGH